MTIKKSFIIALIFGGFLILLAHHLNDKGEVYTFTGSTMGTTYNIKIFSEKPLELQEQQIQVVLQKMDPEGRYYKKLNESQGGGIAGTGQVPPHLHAFLDRLIKTALIRVNQQMSTWINDSELSQFNQAKDSEWIELSPSVLEVINLAQEINGLSEGYFDITVGPLVNLWGFGPNGKPEKIPDQAQIEATLSEIGMNNLRIERENNRIQKLNSKTYVDLSAIAKGYGVDFVFHQLEQLGIANILVEIGGELRAKGVNQRQQAWVVGIERPVELAMQSPFKSIRLQNLAMATSGNYRNYYEQNGVRFSHTIDPKTGKTVDHKLASATVIHESCAVADAWATAFMAMGEQKAMEIAKKNNILAYFLVKDGDGFKELSSFSNKFSEMSRL